jgi:hypothetical protein
MTEPEARESPQDRRRLHFDGTITAGNVLTAAAMVVALLAWGFRLEARVDTERVERVRFEAEMLRKATQDDERERRALDEVRTGLRRIEDILLGRHTPPRGN